MLSLRVSRDKGGYDHIYLLYESRRKGRPVTRLVYGGRWPSPMRVGQQPLDEATRRTLEQAHPDITFDWTALQRTLQQALSISRAPVLPDRDRRRRPSAGPSAGAPPGPGPSDAAARSRPAGRGVGAPARPGQPSPGRPAQRGPSYPAPDRRQGPGQVPPYAPAAGAGEYPDDLAAGSGPDRTPDRFGVPTDRDERDARDDRDQRDERDPRDEIEAYETPLIEAIEFARGGDLEQAIEQAMDRGMDPTMDPRAAFDEALVAGHSTEIQVEVEQTFVVIANGEADADTDTDDAPGRPDASKGHDEVDPVEVARGPAADPWSAVMTSLQEQAPEAVPTTIALPPSGLDVAGQPAAPRGEAATSEADQDQARPRRRRRRGGRRSHGDQPQSGRETDQDTTAGDTPGDSASAPRNARADADGD